MALSRSAITRGVGAFYHGSPPVAIPSVDGVTAVVDRKTFDVRADHTGLIEKRVQDVEAKIALTPVGVLSTAFLNILYPAAFRNPVIGTSIFGATDTQGIVHSKAGKKITFKSIGLTKMPSLILSAAKQCYGPAEWTALRRNDVEWTDAAALYLKEAAVYAEPSLPSGDVKTNRYTAAWGDIIASIMTEDGWTIDFNVDAKPDMVDGYGTNDYLLGGVSVLARCKPKNLDEDAIDELVVQGADAGIGVGTRRGEDLVIAGGKFTLTLKDAALLRTPLQWKGIEVRNNEIAFEASRVEADGVYGELFDMVIAP